MQRKYARQGFGRDNSVTGLVGNLKLWLADLTATITSAVPVVPKSFLGGYAPSLDFLRLNGIPFPGVPKLLLSTPYLVDLHLRNIPHFGYISPRAMITALSTLPSLKHLWLEFHLSRMWSSQRPPLPTQSVLPALTRFCFRGITGYLQDLVAHIDTPQLGFFSVMFYDQIEFGTP